MENLTKHEINYPYLSKPVSVYTRENGHTIVLAQKQGGLVNISSWVKTGSLNENDKNNGISHFLEHLMFKGTHKHKAGEFDKMLESKGAILNAATWKDYTFYYVTLPKGENDEYFKLALELHADMMLDPILPEDEIGAPFDINGEAPKVKRERHVVIEEIRMRKDQPWTKVYNQLNDAMYQKHPYKRDVIGTEEIISSISRDTIAEYYKTHYTPENITTIVVGEFNEQEVLERVQKEFDFKDRTNKPKEIIELEPLREEPAYIETKSNFSTSFIMFGFLGPIATQLREVIALDMINIILGDGQSSRLQQNLIEKPKEPIFNIIASEHYHFKDGSNFFVQANFKTEKKDEAIELVKSELIDILQEEVSEKEFYKAKKKIKSSFAKEVETVSEIGETIGYYATVLGNIKATEDYLTVLETISKQDLLETARKYLSLNRAVISVVLGVNG